MDLKQFVLSIASPLRQGLEYIYGAIPLSIRYGRVFRETYAFLQESQWWSREKLEEYQMRWSQKFGQVVKMYIVSESGTVRP